MGGNTHKLALCIDVLCVKSNNLSFGWNRISIFFSESPVVLISKWHFESVFATYHDSYLKESVIFFYQKSCPDIFIIIIYNNTMYQNYGNILNFKNIFDSRSFKKLFYFVFKKIYDSDRPTIFL